MPPFPFALRLNSTRSPAESIKYVVAVGEGAGANIVARFSFQNPDRVLGAVLLNCVASTTSLVKFFSEKILSWTGAGSAGNATPESGALGQKVEQFLILHKFGGVSHAHLLPCFFHVPLPFTRQLFHMSLAQCGCARQRGCCRRELDRRERGSVRYQAEMKERGSRRDRRSGFLRTCIHRKRQTQSRAGEREKDAGQSG